jgi:replicative superfamily II helicase
MLDATKYRQMAGRAGRAGFHTASEAILLASRDNMPALQLQELMVVSTCAVQYHTVKYRTASTVRYCLVQCSAQQSV